MAAEKITTPFDALSQMMPFSPNAAAAALGKPQAQMMEAMFRQNIEMLDFLRARFERDRALVAKMAAASESGDVMTLWAEFWQKTLADYSSETSKLASTATELAEQAVRSATAEAAALSETLKAKG